jgi:hypothetical protein
MRKILVILSALLGASLAHAGPFTDGTVLTAAALNNALAAPTITGGSINSTPIGASTPSTGAFTTLSTTGNATVGGTLGVTGALSASSISLGANGLSIGSGQLQMSNGNLGLGVTPGAWGPGGML